MFGAAKSFCVSAAQKATEPYRPAFLLLGKTNPEIISELVCALHASRKQRIAIICALIPPHRCAGQMQTSSSWSRGGQTSTDRSEEVAVPQIPLKIFLSFKLTANCQYIKKKTTTTTKQNIKCAPHREAGFLFLSWWNSVTYWRTLHVNIKTIFRIKIPEDAAFSLFGFLPQIR